MEHPDITKMNRYGTLDLRDEPVIKCPVCGKECDTFFKYGREIVGCEMCIKEVDAYEEEM